MLTDELKLEQGSSRDYLALAEHHYLARRPATMTRVWVLRRTSPTVIGRYLQQGEQTQVIAVLVESLPALLCRMRSVALDDRHGSWLPPGQRAKLINAEIRCISRVVVHPQWRGLGLAVRLVRHALETATTIYTEALAAMGKVHPFFERAGMLPYHRPPHAFDDRLQSALHAVGITCEDLALLEKTWQRIEQLPGAKRVWLLHEVSRWYRQTVGRGKKPPNGSCPRKGSLEELRAARDRLLLEPVYYVHDNRV